MELTFDAQKRLWTLEDRNLDFADAISIFADEHLTLQDDREEYGEDRFITFGSLKGRYVIVVWTPRNNGRRIISMRHANDRERKRYKAALDRPG